MAKDDFRGAARVFARSFYSQGTSDRAASADKVIDEALRFFGEENPERLSPYDRGVELARRVGKSRDLLILDGMEPLQDLAGEIKDESLEALLTTLIYRNDGLCIVTTREEIRRLQESSNHEEIILQRLAPAASRQLLKKLRVHGDRREIARAVEENEGHALAITLLGTYLVERFDGDIANIKRVTYPPGFDDAPSMPSTKLLKGRERESRHARRMIASYEKWFTDEPNEVNAAALIILRFMGLFNRPPEPGCIAALRAEPIEGLSEALFAGRDIEETWQEAIVRLRDARLLEKPETDWNKINCHPLIREYFAEQLALHQAEPAKDAHRRLYEHLKSTAPDLPDNLNDMMPLYHAVAHACKAEQFTAAYDLYLERIQRKEEGYSHRVLGVFSLERAAMANFFSQPFTQLHNTWTDDARKADVLGISGARLRSLGALKTACELLRRSILAYKTLVPPQPAWLVRRTRQLSESLFALGELEEACKVAEESVNLASEHKREYDDFTNCCVWGCALHYVDNREAARTTFQNAHERMKAFQCSTPQIQPTQHLYSLWGFRYWEFLLDDADLECCLNIQRQIASIQDNRTNKSGAPQNDPEKGLGPIGELLERLSACMAQLEGTREAPSNDLMQKLESVCTELRRLGRHDFIPYGLLACVRCFRLASEHLPEQRKSYHEKAHEFLRQTWDLALRDELRVFQAEAWIETAHLCIAQKADNFHTYLGTLTRHWEPQRLTDELCNFISTCYRRRKNLMEALRPELKLGDPGKPQ